MLHAWIPADAIDPDLAAQRHSATANSVIYLMEGHDLVQKYMVSNIRIFCLLYRRLSHLPAQHHWLFRSYARLPMFPCMRGVRQQISQVPRAPGCGSSQTLVAKSTA